MTTTIINRKDYLYFHFYISFKIIYLLKFYIYLLHFHLFLFRINIIFIIKVTK